MGEYDGAGNAIQEIVWLGDTPVATVRQEACGLSIFYIHTDHLNTPRRITRRSTSDVVWSWDSDPFGATAPNENPSGLGSFSFNLRFRGQYYDAETALNYNYARDYDPGTGRYVESDPLGLKAGVNTYAYVGGDPISRVDLVGLDFLGKSLAQQYLCKYGRDAWDKIRRDRDSTKPVPPGTPWEAMRNAEHYLYAYGNVDSNNYAWGQTSPTQLVITL
jgi:RHS repeat-associated protein